MEWLYKNNKGLCIFLVVVSVAMLFLGWVSIDDKLYNGAGIGFTISDLIDELELLDDQTVAQRVLAKLKDGSVSPLDASYVMRCVSQFAHELKNSYFIDFVDDETLLLLNTAQLLNVLFMALIIACVLLALVSIFCYINDKAYSGYGFAIGISVIAAAFLWMMTSVNSALEFTALHMTPWLVLSPFAAIAASATWKSDRNGAVQGEYSYADAEVTKYDTVPPKASAGKLIAIGGEYNGAEFDISDGEMLTLGRDPSCCNIVYQSSSSAVSRKHCTVRYDGNNRRYYVTDWSSNGTFLSDGTSLLPQTETMLPAGTEIYLSNRSEKYRLA